MRKIRIIAGKNMQIWKNRAVQVLLKLSETIYRGIFFFRLSETNW